jgi:hypothetical protein
LVRDLHCLVIRDPFEREREHAIVRRNKEVPARFDCHWSAPRTHPRVNYHQVNGIGREVIISAKKDISGRRNILRSNFVTDIDDPDRRITTENDTLHGRDIIVGRTEVGEKGNSMHKKFGRRKLKAGTGKSSYTVIFLGGGLVVTSVFSQVRKLSLTDSGAISAIKLV